MREYRILAYMIKHTLIPILFCCSFLWIHGQNITPPLDIPLKLSGTFGEFRPTHFHAGLDIKTQGKEGLKVSAIKKGSIRRIRVALSGYGKCLYIQHADGTTSVYAHLKKFAPKIESFIKAYQYEKESFTVQKFLQLGEITVEQGELIGYSGNTGGSLGPHLHFEIRDTQAETPLNPLQLNFDIPDSIRPIVQGLYRYSLKNNRIIGEKTVLPLTRKNDSVYIAELQRLGGNHALGIRLFDRQDLSYNRNGVYRVILRVNGATKFFYTFDKIDFRDGKKIDALIDYPTYKKEKIRIQKLFRSFDIAYSFLPEKAPNGILNFEKGKAYKVEIIIDDFQQNSTYIEFYVDGSTPHLPPPPAPYTNPIVPDKDYLFVYDQHELYIPKNSFYQTIDLPIKAMKDTLIIGPVDSPQSKGLELTVNLPKELDTIAKRQFSLALYQPDQKKKEKRLRFVWTAKKDSIAWTKNAYTGTYVFTKDSLAPTIKPLNFKPDQWMTNYKFLEVEIEDDFSGIKNYRATLNGKWILMEYEPKDQTLIYQFSDHNFEEAALNFRLEVTDQVENSTTYSATIYRKPKRG